MSELDPSQGDASPLDALDPDDLALIEIGMEIVDEFSSGPQGGSES